MHLNHKQKQIMAEFFINTAVALVAVGIINPLFLPQENTSMLILQISFSITITFVILFIGIYLLRK